MGEIGLQVSSIRDFLQTEKDMRRSFLRVAQMGYRTVQLQWLGEKIPPAAAAEALRDAGLTSVSTQDFYETVKERLSYFVDLNHACGSRILCFSGIPEVYRTSQEGCLFFAGEIRKLEKELAPEGLVLAFHPRSQEFVRLNGRTAAEWVMENVPETVQMGLDLYHVWKAGLSMEEWIRKYQGRQEFVHFKDCKKLPDGQEVLVPVGQGSIPYEGAMRACEECGVRFMFAEQERWEKDAFLCMEESLLWMQRQWRRIHENSKTQ